MRVMMKMMMRVMKTDDARWRIDVNNVEKLSFSRIVSAQHRA
jgi:hypothetical protein